VSLAKDKLIVALDVHSLEDAANLVDKVRASASIFKIGSQLFTDCGPEAVKMVHRKGGKVFLDLKFHDIPNTVKEASRAAARLGVFMFNVHAQGGLSMMRAATEGASAKAERLNIEKPLILGVTVLTSMDTRDLQEGAMKKDVESQVLSLARLAKKAGLNGIVASAKELTSLREAMGKDFLIVTPGVRPAWAKTDDQRRVATPREAIEKGADYIVVGRPIIKADDPKEAAEKILKEIT